MLFEFDFKIAIQARIFDHMISEHMICAISMAECSTNHAYFAAVCEKLLRYDTVPFDHIGDDVQMIQCFFAFGRS